MKLKDALKAVFTQTIYITNKKGIYLMAITNYMPEEYKHKYDNCKVNYILPLDNTSMEISIDRIRR